MAPARPDPHSSVAVPKLSAGRPKIFGGGTRHSARIEKRSTTENERTKELRQEEDQGCTEAEPEQSVRLQRARHGPEFTEIQASRRSVGRALPSDRCLRRPGTTRNTATRASNRDTLVDDIQDESEEAVAHHTTGQIGYHTIAEGGPRLKNIAELIAETDLHQNFRIPSDKIIASEDVDSRVYQQMRRHAKDGNLTPDRVRKNLENSVKELEEWWRVRKPRRRFWECVCGSGTWMSQLDGPDCRAFFLWLCVYFRNVPGKAGANTLIRAFERLVKLFRQEKECELDELDDVQLRLQAPSGRSLGRSRDRTTVGRGAASKKKGSKTMPEDGNIFRWSADTNMTDFELSGIDVEGLTPIVDVGDRRKKNEERKRLFDEELEADRERIRQEAWEQATQEAAAAPKPQLTTQGRQRSSRKRPTPPEVDNMMPEMNQQKPAKAARKFSEFEEDEEDDDGEEEERLRAAALKMQELLERHAARGGPKSD